MRTVNTESLGKVFESNKHGLFVVTHITDSRNIKIKFLKTGNEQFVEIGNIKKGNVADRGAIASINSLPRVDIKALKGSPGVTNRTVKNYVAINPNKTCTEIAAALFLKRSTVSEALRRMLGKGLEKTCVTKRTVTWRVCDEPQKSDGEKERFNFCVSSMKVV